ncbi:MAG: insulinase family protein [Betaproteobacteria bacterium]|nr:insulinase family protein [Betaproteobacteria bacterium]MBI2290375.1 insulinase family protein [Betaproteobacteria bacterium]MBI3056246.1 insulinase family protein [Betaproteobacteria bacterium]
MRNRRLHLWLALVVCVISAPAYALLPIQHWQTGSGAQVYFVANRDLPMLDVSVDFPAGSAFDTREKSGLAALTQRLLKLGAGGLSEDEIARRMADVGAQLGGRFDSDRAGLSLRTLSSAEEMKEALSLLAGILQRPEFPPPVLEREKTRIIGAIRESDTKPEGIAGRNFNALIYGDHPYGLRSSGEADTVARLTREDLAGFYRRHYTADRAVVAIIGNVSRGEAESIAEQLTGELPRAGAPASLPDVAPLARAETRTIAHPALQSHVLIGAPGIKRSDPDYFPLFIGNYILGGGGFASRILEEVRQKRGLAYSAYSYFSPLQQPGPFVMGLQTRKDQAGEAVAVVRATLKEFLAQGPTADELEKAKQNIVGGFPLRIDSNRKILGYLAVIGFYQLPLTYLDDFVPSIEKVTLADIRNAFARRVDLERLVTVIVGADEAALGAAK